MKQGWEIKKLGEICNKITNIKWNEIDKTTSFPYIDLSAVDRENSSIHDYEYINISNAPSRAKQIVKVGDILFATTRPMLKRACIIPNEFNNAIASTGFCVLRPQGTVLSGWIYHNIKSNRFYKYIEPIQKGVSYPAVTDNEVKDFCIPVPPRDEQERIVEELDCLSSVIEKKREQLREFDALAQSIFYQMFGDPITNEKGWEVKKLKNITSKIGSGATPKGGNESYKDEGISLIRSLNIHNNLFVYKDLAHIDEEQADALKNVVVEDGDVLLNITGASVARCCVVPNDVLPARVNQHVAIIRPKELGNNIFICYQFTSNAFQQELLSIGKSNGATREALTKGQLEELDIIVPPLTLQQEFAEKIEKIEQQKALIKQSITQTEELFNARMDYYFN